MASPVSPLHADFSLAQAAASFDSVQLAAQSVQFASEQDESCMLAPEALQATPRPARQRPNSNFFIFEDSVPIVGRRSRRPVLMGSRGGSLLPDRREQATPKVLDAARLRAESGLRDLRKARNTLLARADEPGDPWEEAPDDDTDAVDLHGLTVERALRRVAQALHAARVRGRKRLLVVTGAGWGNQIGRAHV